MIFNLKPKGQARRRFHEFKRFINIVVMLSVMPVIGYVVFRGAEIVFVRVSISKREALIYILALAYLVLIRIADTKVPGNKRMI